MPVPLLGLMIGSAALGGIGTGIAGALTASAQEEAAQRNAEALKEINRLQIEWAKETGVYPYHLREQERALARQAWDTSQVIARDPNQALAEYRRLTESLSGILPGTIADVTSGAWERKQLEALKPVAEARLSSARAGADAWNVAIQSQLKAMEAANARGGYRGRGSAETSRAIAGAAQGLNAAKQAVLQAELQNASEALAVRQKEAERLYQLAMQSPEIAGALIKVAQAPYGALAQEYLTRLSPFETFRVGRAGALPIQAPQYQSSIPAGAIAAQGFGTLGTTIGQYFAQQDAYEQLMKLAAMQYGKRM